MKRTITLVILLGLICGLWLTAQYTTPKSTGAPTGTAGGKLSGTYPNPGLNAACADLSNGSGGCSMSTTAGGDLSGALPSPTVAKLNGVAAALYALLASPAFTGTPTVPSAAASTNTTQAASTAYVGSQLVDSTPGAGSIAKICTTVALTGQSASIGTTNLLCNGAQAPAGVYRVAATMITTTGQSGSGNTTLTVLWTTNGATQGAANGLIGALSQTAGTEVPPPGVANQSGQKLLHHDGTTHITYSTTYTSTGQYDLYIVLERLL